MALSLVLISGCTLHSDTLRLERDIANLRTQQQLILDQLGDVEETRAKVTTLAQAVEALRREDRGGLPGADEIFALLASERQRTEHRLALVQEMVEVMERRLAASEKPPPTPISPVEPATAPVKPVIAQRTPIEPQPAPPSPAVPEPKAAPATARQVVIPATPATTPNSHTVAPGDTLGTIAAQYLGTPSRWEQVWHANPWLPDPDRLEVGQVLTLPESPMTTAEPSLRHTVAAGETLGTIAALYLGSSSGWKAVWHANPELTNPDHVTVGTVVIVPVPLTYTPSGTPRPKPPKTPPAPPLPAAPPAPPVVKLVPHPAEKIIVKKITKAPLPAATPEPGTVRHTVIAGDTLGTIAARYLGDAALWEWVWEANPYLEDPDRLAPGRVLLVPVLGDPSQSGDMDLEPPATPGEPAVAAPPPGETAPSVSDTREPTIHTVGPGDTLGTIAARYLGSPSQWKQVWLANPQLSDPNRLHTGQPITIPTPPLSQHTVQAGETLGAISERYFGSNEFWDAIWAANPQLSSPDQLKPGQVLNIPQAVPLPGY